MLFNIGEDFAFQVHYFRNGFNYKISVLDSYSSISRDCDSLKGGIMDIEAPLHISNVMVLCPKCDKPSRIRKKTLEDSGRVRICGKCGEILDKV